VSETRQESINKDWKVTPAKAESLMTALSENCALNMPFAVSTSETVTASMTDADIFMVTAVVSAPVAASGTVMNTENEEVRVSVAMAVSATADTNTDFADTLSDGTTVSLIREMKLTVAANGSLAAAAS